MGQFPTLDSFISRGLAYTPTNTIDARSAWLFENQSGTLGTNLTGSSVYVGTTGTVKVVISGTVASTGGGVTSITFNTPANGGTGYVTGNGLVTVVVRGGVKVSTGLTVDIIAVAGVITQITVNAPGTNYTIGEKILVMQTGSDDGASFFVSSVTSNIPGAGDAVEFVNAQAGSILPVVVDYILIPAANAATDLVVGK
ncbi:MAG: hypothetical protein N2B06_11710 [Clostridium sp.]|jgi:hypothetical protein|tara:strand:- start:42 stop:635 length:594 start_codon:yes stop_codon:yes gene_type:complete